MTFLPIVERELRVAARKRNTFWVRIIAALVALVIAGGFLTLAYALRFGITQFGNVMFGVLTWLSLAAALCAGLFFTSDALSEEKREGTLGFLFLTDLRGYDVVLGKLLVTSLRGCFALLAVFPILAICLLMGGVTGSEFWKTILALANALFCSLAAGLFVSSISRDSQKALAGSFFVTLLFVAGGPIVDGLLAAAPGKVFKPWFSLSSPGFVFMNTDDWTARLFWRGLMVNQAVAWLLMVLACALVPRTWQQKRTRNVGSQKSWSYVWKYGGRKRRLRLQQKLLSRNPALWLACRERWQSLTMWIITLLLVGVVGVLLVLGTPAEFWFGWNYFSWVFTLAIYLAAASQASRFFVDARRSGLVELLLASPLSGREIVQGNWRGLVRLFAIPVMLYITVEIFTSLLSQRATFGIVAGAGGQGTPTVNLAMLIPIFDGFVMALNLVAVCWFGMWMGMTSKNVNFATLKTLVFVQVIPWFIIYFTASMLVPLLLIPTLARANSTNAASGWNFYALYQGVIVGMALLKAIGFLILARHKLNKNFREMAVRAVIPIRPGSPMRPAATSPAPSVPPPPPKSSPPVLPQS